MRFFSEGLVFANEVFEGRLVVHADSTNVDDHESFFRVKNFGLQSNFV